jgi:hypothetical protein
MVFVFVAQATLSAGHSGYYLPGLSSLIAVEGFPGRLGNLPSPVAVPLPYFKKLY